MGEIMIKNTKISKTQVMSIILAVAGVVFGVVSYFVPDIAIAGDSIYNYAIALGLDGVAAIIGTLKGYANKTQEEIESAKKKIEAAEVAKAEKQAALEKAALEKQAKAELLEEEKAAAKTRLDAEIAAKAKIVEEEKLAFEKAEAEKKAKIEAIKAELKAAQTPPTEVK